MRRLRDWARKYWLAGVIVILPLLVILPPVQAFPYSPVEDAYSDLAITHYPNAYFLRHELAESRSIPLWSPSILSGYPFFANPLSGLFYAPGWLALLLPLPLGFNLLAAIHSIWGAFGMAMLMRSQGLNLNAALFAGLGLVLMPKAVAHYAAGHLTLIYAISWTPWLIFLAHREREFPVSNKPRPRWVQPGLVMAIILLADVRWGAFSLFVWWIYSIAHSNNRYAMVKVLTRQTFLAFLLSSPLLIPLLEYASLSTRNLMAPEDVLAYSLPPVRMLGLVIPGLGGNHEWVLYPGGAILCLSIVALVRWRYSKPTRFWIILAFASLLLSLGEHIPGASFMAGIPGINMLRVPSRALFMTGIALSALAGWGLDALNSPLDITQTRAIRLGLVAISSFSVLLALAVSIVSGTMLFNYLLGAAAITLSATLIGVRFSRFTHRVGGVWILGMVCLVCIDLIIEDRTLLAYRSSEGVLNEGASVALWLSKQGGEYRIYSPSYSLPQQTAARYGLELADGIDPLQLASYANFMAQATGIHNSGYSVTLPPFTSGYPRSANVGSVPDAELLALLNVQYVASSFEITADGLILRDIIDEVYLYENLNVMARSWVVPENSDQSGFVQSSIILKRTPNFITLRAQGPGVLVLSELDYPGWRAQVDGKTVEIDKYAGILRSVQLPPGSHEVTFSFTPISLYLGCILALGGIALLGWSIRTRVKM